MKKTIQFTLLAGALFFTARAIQAQSVIGKNTIIDGYINIEIGKALSAMPEIGARAEDFVPSHWKIFARADGDLNADGINDTAMILTVDSSDARYVKGLQRTGDDDTWVSELYLIVVVDSRGDKRLHFHSENHVIGQVPAGERDEFKVSMKKNVFDVYTDTGGEYRVEQTYHFRMDPPTGGDLRLIGYDENHYTTSNDSSDGKWTISENYLTNTRVDTKYTIHRGEFVPVIKKSIIRPLKISFSSAADPISDH
jgi:hypothetical protein